MLIKPMETEDEVRGKAFVHYQAWREAYAGLLAPEFLNGRTLALSEERARLAFQSGVATVLAKDGERVAGFADYGPYRGDDLSDAGEVYAIYVLRAYYGRGVGRALMRQALSGLPEYGSAAVWVLKGNERAIRFYTRFGYRFDGAEQTRTLGGPVTELRMLLRRRSLGEAASETSSGKDLSCEISP